MQSFTSCLMYVVPFRCVSTWLELNVSFVKSDFSAVFNQSSIWLAKMSLSKCLPQVESSSWRRSAGFKTRVSKTFVCIKTIWQPFIWKDVASAQFWAMAGNLTEEALHRSYALSLKNWDVGSHTISKMLIRISLVSISQRTGQSSRGKHISLTWKEEWVRARQEVT